MYEQEITLFFDRSLALKSKQFDGLLSLGTWFVTSCFLQCLLYGTWTRLDWVFSPAPPGPAHWQHSGILKLIQYYIYSNGGMLSKCLNLVIYFFRKSLLIYPHRIRLLEKHGYIVGLL